MNWGTVSTNLLLYSIKGCLHSYSFHFCKGTRSLEIRIDVEWNPGHKIRGTRQSLCLEVNSKSVRCIHDSLFLCHPLD